MSSSSWPLIEKLYADDVYRAIYDAYLEEVIDGAFKTIIMIALYDYYAALIEDYVNIERYGYSFLESYDDFDDAIDELKEHAVERDSAVRNYLR